jgi:pimeloyl-ACP methyl ester carboxylesterase
MTSQPAAGVGSTTAPDLTPKLVSAEDYASPVPGELSARAKDVLVEERRVSVSLHSHTWDVFYREATLPGGRAGVKTLRSGRGLETYVSEEVRPPVVLLHGTRFTSWLWEDGDVLQVLAALGHRVVALDLPGCGETSGQPISTELIGEFLARFLHRARLNTTLPVLISPAGAEPYALPYILGASRRSADRRVTAALLVSPGWPRSLLDTPPACTDIPALIIYDSTFPGWRKAEGRIQEAFRQARYLEVMGGRSMGYPAHWHATTTIVNFLLQHCTPQHVKKH